MGSIVLIAALGGDALPDHQHHGFDSARLGRQLQSLLGPRPTQEDLRLAIFAFANVTAQLAGEEPLSPDLATEFAVEAAFNGLS